MKDKAIKYFAIYDLETSGLDRDLDQPIEVAIKIIDRSGKITNYHSLIKYDIPLSQTIEDLTGITDKMLEEQGKPLETVLKKVNRLLTRKGTLVIGHQILKFDNEMLNSQFSRRDYPLIDRNSSFDTAAQMKAEIIKRTKRDVESWGRFHGSIFGAPPRTIRYNLKDACSHYKIKVKENFHRASVDMECTYEIFKKQNKKLGI